MPGVRWGDPDESRYLRKYLDRTQARAARTMMRNRPGHGDELEWAQKDGGGGRYQTQCADISQCVRAGACVWVCMCI